MIQTKQEIQRELELIALELIQWFEKQSASQFDKGPDGKWTSAQHLNHLIKATQPLHRAMKKPKLIIRYMFGRPNRESRGYLQVKERYYERLSKADTSNNPYNVEPISNDLKVQLLKEYLKETKKLISSINSWKEKQLDSYLFPHPLMGKLLVREMLFFTHFHTLHHLNILKSQYSESED